MMENLIWAKGHAFTAQIIHAEKKEGIKLEDLLIPLMNTTHSPMTPKKLAHS